LIERNAIAGRRAIARWIVEAGS